MIGQDDIKYADGLERSAIIKDLLKNRPSGPASNPVTYNESEIWCPKKGQQIKKLVPSNKYFGYDKKILFNLGLKSIEDVRKILRKSNFDGKFPYGSKKRTYTRQCNLLWRRLEPAIKSTLEEGGVGAVSYTHQPLPTNYSL